MSNNENTEVVVSENTESIAETKTTTKKKSTKLPPKAAAEKPVARKKITPVDRNDLVEVRSCVYGELNYVSYSTGNRITWQTFDDPNWITVADLMEMRNSQRAFFEKNWVVLVGDNAKDVMQYLQIERYYKTISTIEDIDEIFNYPVEDVPAIIEKLSDSTKETLARRAYALINSGELDSKKMINTLEDVLGYDLTEPQ